VAPNLISIDEVMRRTSIRRTKLYELIHIGDFPLPIKIGTASRWADTEVAAWIQARMQGRGLELH
jgi:prophage regulatory protein